ncbi:MAG: YnbE family lipoprotein [Dehalococcoidia bacterium]
MTHGVRSGRARGAPSRGPALHLSFLILLGALIGGGACTPKVQVEAPKEPIEINLNIKIEHEIRVKVDDDLEQLFEEDEEIF